MAVADLHLDGNAVAGMLSEVFSVEATTAVVTCATCGATGAVGAVMVYSHAPGVVLRCPECTQVLMRFTRIRSRMVADFGGISRLDLPA